jgi:hypothetical protein
MRRPSAIAGLILVLLSSGGLQAQEAVTFDAGCAFRGELLEKQLYLFNADKGIETYLGQLLEVGEAKAFRIKASNTESAAAVLLGRERFLLYDQYSYATLDTAGRRKWVLLAALAHQMGHHQKGHDFSDDPARRREQELEADVYAGFALKRLGAPIGEVKAALDTYSLDETSRTYPAWAERTASVETAWRRRETAADDPPPHTTSFGEDLPTFEWPPPRPSARVEVPRQLLAAGPLLLGDVAERLEEALREAGYGDRSYYAVPGGFALVAELEQIEEDGSPRSGDERWSVKVPARPTFSLAEYLRALFTSARGRFRIIVFAVTSEPIRHAQEGAEFEVATDWLLSGNSKLPPSVGSLGYGSTHSCTALIYEFERSEAVHETILTNPSAVSGQIHLAKAGIWAALTGGR